MTVLWDGHQTRSENIRGVYLVTLGVKWYWALIRFAGAVSSCPLELRLIRPALQVTANPHQRIFFFFLPVSRTLLSDPVCNTGTEVTPLWLRTQKMDAIWIFPLSPSWLHVFSCGTATQPVDEDVETYLTLHTLARVSWSLCVGVTCVSTSVPQAASTRRTS